MILTSADSVNLLLGHGVPYGKLTLYPVCCKDAYLFDYAKSAFLVNQMQEKNLSLIGLPYLDYLYAMASKNKNNMHIWIRVIYVMRLSFRTDNIKTVHEGRAVGLRVTQGECSELIFWKQFDELKNIICQINDVPLEVFDPDWEKLLQDAQSKLTGVTGEGLDIEDRICTMGVLLNKTPEEIGKMTIRAFDRYWDLATMRDEYRLNHLAELCGTKFKTKITHWMKHYHTHGRYDNVLSNKNKK